MLRDESFLRVHINITFLNVLSKLFHQTFIFMTVVYFGPLTCSIVTTTRKFFTILGSVILFGNVMTMMQWVGTILVFLGESSFWFDTLLSSRTISICMSLLPAYVFASKFNADIVRDDVKKKIFSNVFLVKLVK